MAKQKNAAAPVSEETPAAAAPNDKPAIDVDALLAQLGTATSPDDLKRMGEEILDPLAAEAERLPPEELHRLSEGVRAIHERLAAPHQEVTRSDGLDAPSPFAGPVGAPGRPHPNLDAIRAELEAASSPEDLAERLRPFALGSPDWSAYSEEERGAVRALADEVSATKWPPPEPEAPVAVPEVLTGPRKLLSSVVVFDVLAGRREELPVGTLEAEVLRRAHPADWASFASNADLWGR